TSTPSARRCRAMRGCASSGSRGSPPRARTTHSPSLAGRFTTGSKPRWAALPARPSRAPQFRWVSGRAVEGPQRLEATRRGERLARSVRRPQGVAACHERAVQQLIERAGPGEQEALTTDATKRQERRSLLLELYALRHGVESERLAEGHHGAHELRSAVRIGQPAHEGTVDFEDVDRETMQVGERRVAGAEIVDRKPDAEGLQAAESLEVRVAVVHDGALGELDDEIVRLESGFTQRLGDVMYQIALFEVAGRDVHREPQGRSAGDGLAPGAHVAAGLPQHPAAELGDVAALLHHLDEARRHQYPGLGVPPAHERLDAEDAPRAEVDDRLIFEEELLLSERAPNIRLEAQALLQQV